MLLQLSSDPFMKQLGHASEIVSLLGNENDNMNDEMIGDLLKAQLSHSDGIRGFFVSYLTGDGVTAADGDDIPLPLMDAMNSVETDELISLSCEFSFGVFVSCMTRFI